MLGRYDSNDAMTQMLTQLLVGNQNLTMYSNLKNSYSTLTVKGKEQLFVSSFSGYLKIGTIKQSQVSIKCAVFRVDQFVTLAMEIEKCVSFLQESDETTFESNHPNLENISLVGTSQDCNCKSVGFYKDGKIVFELDLPEFNSLIKALSRSMLFTFVFKDIEIQFFQTLIDDCHKEKHNLKLFKKDNNLLDTYVKSYLAQQKAPSQSKLLNLSTVLKMLFQNYYKILKAILDLTKLYENEAEKLAANDNNDDNDLF